MRRWCPLRPQKEKKSSSKDEGAEGPVEVMHRRIPGTLYKAHRWTPGGDLVGIPDPARGGKEISSLPPDPGVQHSPPSYTGGDQCVTHSSSIIKKNSYNNMRLWSYEVMKLTLKKFI